MAELSGSGVGDGGQSTSTSDGGDDSPSSREMQRRIRDMGREAREAPAGTEPTKNPGSDPMMDGPTTEVDSISLHRGMSQFMDSPGSGVTPDSTPSSVRDLQGTGVGADAGDTTGDQTQSDDGQTEPSGSASPQQSTGSPVTQLQGTGVGASPVSTDQPGSTGSSGSSGVDISPQLPDGRRVPTGDDPDADGQAGEVQGTFVSNQGIESGSVRGIGEFERQQAAKEAEASIIKETEFLDDPDQIRVTESGDIELTTMGREAQREFRRERFKQEVAGRNPGLTASNVTVDLDAAGGPEVGLTETGRAQAAGLVAASAQGGRRQIQTGSVEERFAERAGNAVTVDEVSTSFSGGTVDVAVQPRGGVSQFATRRGGQRAIQEQAMESAIAERSGGAVSKGEVDVDLTGTDPNISISEQVPVVAQQGGGRRSLQREQIARRAAESGEDFIADDFNVDLTDTGGTVSLSEAGRERVVRERATEQILQENPNLELGDFTVDFEPRRQGNPRPTGAGIVSPGMVGGVDVDFTQSGKEKLIQEQVASERESVDEEDVSVVFDEEGDVQSVEFDERFGDDGGAVLGIPGVEDEFDQAADFYSQFAAGVGEAAGHVGRVGDFAAQPLSNIKEAPTIKDPFRRSATAFTTAAFELGNVPGTIRGLDETGEFIGAYAASGLTAGIDYDNLLEGEGQVIVEKEETASEFESDAIAAGQYKAGEFAETAVENPLTTTATVAGSLVGSYAAIRGATAVSSRAGGIARGVIQPGEELLGVGGFRATKAVAGESNAQRLFPNQEPLIFSEEAAIRAGRAGIGRVRSLGDQVTPRSFAADTRGQLNLEFEKTDVETESETSSEGDSELGVPEDPFRVSDKRLFDPAREFGEIEDVTSKTDPTNPSGVSESDIGEGVSGRGDPQTATGSGSFEENFNRAIGVGEEPSVDLRGRLPVLSEIRRQTPTTDARTVETASTSDGQVSEVTLGGELERIDRAQRLEVALDDTVSGEDERFESFAAAEEEAAGALATDSLISEEAARLSDAQEMFVDVEAAGEMGRTTDSVTDGVFEGILGTELEAEPVVEGEAELEGEQATEGILDFETAIDVETETELLVESEVETETEVETEAEFEFETKRDLEGEFDILDGARQSEAFGFGIDRSEFQYTVDIGTAEDIVGL